MGSDFYDNPHQLAQYLERRHTSCSVNKLLEQPVFLSLLPPLQKRTVLDLGCGDASICEHLIKAGINSYRGIDDSEGMVSLAQEKYQHSNISMIRGDIQDTLHYPPNSYDLVISRLAFHYIKSLGELFRLIYQSLVPEGHLVFSAEHPITTSHQLSPEEAKNRRGWQLDHYFKEGERTYHWLGGPVTKYHHTLEKYFLSLTQAGFQVEQLREPSLSGQAGHDSNLVERYSQAPIYLVICAKKTTPYS